MQGNVLQALTNLAHILLTKAKVAGVPVTSALGLAHNLPLSKTQEAIMTKASKVSGQDWLIDALKWRRLPQIVVPLLAAGWNQLKHLNDCGNLRALVSEIMLRKRIRTAHPLMHIALTDILALKAPNA
jgi:hypothetical protein